MIQVFKDQSTQGLSMPASAQVNTQQTQPLSVWPSVHTQQVCDGHKLRSTQVCLVTRVKLSRLVSWLSADGVGVTALLPVLNDASAGGDLQVWRLIFHVFLGRVL